VREELVLKGGPRRRPIFAGEGAHRRPADPEGDKRSGGREEREHEESRIAAAVVRSRGWGYQSSKIRPGVGYWAD